MTTKNDFDILCYVAAPRKKSFLSLHRLLECYNKLLWPALYQTRIKLFIS